MELKIRNVFIVFAFLSFAAQAQPVVKMTISDIDGDGLAGCFKFTSLDSGTCAGAHQFSSDGSVIGGVAGSTIPGASTDGAILFDETQGPDDFTLGFYFTGFEMKPVTAGIPKGKIKSGVMKISSWPFAVRYNSFIPNSFPMDPDPGTLDVVVTGKNHDNSYNYLMTWSHLITPADDPTGQFVAFNAFWRLEGVAFTCASQGISDSCSRSPGSEAE